MNVLLLLFIIIGKSIARDVESCYTNEDDPYLYMGAKTAYTFVSGSGSQFSPILKCEPMQFWMIAKHDARYPTASKIETLLHLPKIRDQIIMNHEIEHSGHMCEEDLNKLKSWWPDPNMRAAMAKEMTTRSVNDVRLFARRLQSHFPELLRPQNEDMTLNNYIFRTSANKAAQSAMESFKESLFYDKYNILPDLSKMRSDDTLLKKYENCSHTDQNEDSITQNAFTERDKFLNSTQFSYVLQNVSRRTGFKYELSSATILMMYDMCRFDKAWAPDRLSPWCSVFSKEDLKAIEYAEDIMYYYSNGYGRQDKTSIGCFALQDLVQYFKKLENQVNNSTMPKGIFYFTDTTAMLGTLTSMGIREDNQMLLSSNYNNMAKRQWRTSIMAPFNSNLIAHSVVAETSYHLRAKLDWISKLRDDIANNVDEYKIITVTSASQKYLLDEPCIRDLLVDTVNNNPTHRVSINISAIDNENKMIEIQDSGATFFIVINDIRKTSNHFSAELIKLMEKLSIRKVHVRYLVIIFSLNCEQNMNTILRDAWKKQMADFTIIEFFDSYNEGNKIFKNYYPTEPKIHLFNPFLNSFTHTFYSLQPELFPDIMKNLYGYPLKVGVFHNPPFSYVRWHDNQTLMNMSGAAITVIKTLALKMNFTLQIAPRLRSFPEIKDNSLPLGFFELMKSGHLDILADISPHFTERLAENAFRPKPIFLGEFCPLIPITYEIRIPFSWALFEAIIVTIAIILSFWIVAIMLRFTKKYWGVFTISRLLFGIPIKYYPTKSSQRVLISILTLISLNYTAIIYGSLAKVGIETDIEIEYHDFDDLVNSGLIPIIPQYLYEKTFGKSEGAILKLKNKSINTTEIWNCPVNVAKYKNVTCLMEKLAGEIFIKSEERSGRKTMKFMKTCLWSDSFTFLLRKGSPYRQAMEYIITRFFEVGLQIKWFNSDFELSDSDENADDFIEQFSTPQTVLIHQLLGVSIFGLNLIICEDPESPNKVMFYLQEKPLMIEGCQVGLCDWEYLKNRFRRVLDECDPQRCYTRSESISNHGSMISLLITLLFILTY
ncbi:hypothetical protein PV325_002478 [Microctonus aethiopoides]|nr:hypothetical protein PV325_002478 [Microctonus aethiopoides]